MTVRPWAPEPRAGDIVQCRFPKEKLGAPGAKDRPALVIEVETDPLDQSRSIVRVAYGTSQDVEQRYAGELTVRATDPKAGLDRDTKFDLGNCVRLPFDTEWFAPSPNRRYGEHPKRGVLDLGNLQVKRALQAAVLEARKAGRL
ncbi:MAG: type II toxin-antitoxin system PemK/MazF family toxin [Burkholderiales bacterium]|nr:type II toxin-antitoxin system PemK/MazF family toxin [Burkholderiales bacterium]